MSSLQPWKRHPAGFASIAASDVDSTHRLGAQQDHGDEAITGFGLSGAIPLDAKRHSSRDAPAVIPPLPDVDFRQLARQRRNLAAGRPSLQEELGSLTSMRRDGRGPIVPPRDSNLHRTGGEDTNNGKTADRINDGEQRKGLMVRSEAPRDDFGSRPAAPLRDATPPKSSKVEVTPPPELGEEAARQALLQEARGERYNQHRNANDDLTIPLSIDEETVLRSDVDDRPDAPTLDTYAAIPVEGFGAAMLRGMGWSEGMGAGKKRDGPASAALSSKRPQLLGLGAKERQRADLATGGSKRADYSSSRPRTNQSRLNLGGPSASSSGHENRKGNSRNDRDSTRPEVSRNERDGRAETGGRKRDDHDRSRAFSRGASPPARSRDYYGDDDRRPWADRARDPRPQGRSIDGRDSRGSRREDRYGGSDGQHRGSRR